MARKRYRVTVTFPDLPAAHAEQEAKADAGNMRVATARALAEIFSRRPLKRRRIRSATIRVRLLDEEVRSEPTVRTFV